MSIEAGQNLMPEGYPSSNITTEVDISKHPSGIIPQLQNVVATCYLGRKLDLKHIAAHARNAEYNPKRFAAVIMRIRNPKTTALVFSSGKMVCTGAKSEKDVKLASRKFTKMIQKLGFEDAKFDDFKVQNIVGSCDVFFPIRLEGLHYKHSLFSSYEPELFPGLIYRMKVPKVVLLIFVSGKVVLTGAKTREEIYAAFETIYPALVEFRKRDSAPGLNSMTDSKKRTASLSKSEQPALEVEAFQSIMSNINSLHTVDMLPDNRLSWNLVDGNVPSDMSSDRKRVKLESGRSRSIYRGESAEISSLHGAMSWENQSLATGTDWRTQIPPPTPRFPNHTSSP